MSQRRNLTGHAAEDIAQRHYLAAGYTLLERRWRSSAGEIDLVLRHQDTFVFVEVKARATHDAAAHAISPAQWARIMASAAIYADQCQGDTVSDLRFDAALIDRTGACLIIENAPMN